MTPVQDKRVRRAIHRFQEAVTEYAFIGSIPLFSEDRKEDERIQSACDDLTNTYTRARVNLERVISSLVDESNAAG